MRNQTSLVALALVGGLALASCASVQDGENEAVAPDSLVGPDESAGPGHPHGPPPELLEACEGLSAGAECSFRLPARTIEGSCLAPPDGDAPLACAPADLPHGPPGAPPGPPGGPPPGADGPGPDGPPEQALSACAELSASAACSFTLPARSIEGTCRNGPEGEGELACIPQGMPPHHGPGRETGGRHQGPPPEALAACAERDADASCTVSLPARTVEGSCRPGPNGEGALACAPEGMGPPPGPPPGLPPGDGTKGPHRGGPPEEAVAACSGSSVSAACSFTLPARTMSGTCRQGPDGQGELACVPPHGPPPPPPAQP